MNRNMKRTEYIKAKLINDGLMGAVGFAAMILFAHALIHALERL